MIYLIFYWFFLGGAPSLNDAKKEPYSKVCDKRILRVPGKFFELVIVAG